MDNLIGSDAEKKRQQRCLFFLYAVVFLLYVFQSEALFMQASVGYRLDDSASDLFTGVAGRLTGKIICHTVNDHRSSEDGIDEEPFVIKHLICIALIAQKRGKVSGMLRMGHVVGIVMISGLVKRYAAVPVFMNMHTVEIAGTLYMDIGKPEDFGCYQDSAVRGLIKFYRSCKLGLGSIPLDPCDSGRRRMGQEILKMRSRCRLIHGYLTNSFLSSICRKVPVSYSVTGDDGLIMAAAVSVPKFPFIHGFKSNTVFTDRKGDQVGAVLPGKIAKKRHDFFFCQIRHFVKVSLFTEVPDSRKKASRCLVPLADGQLIPVGDMPEKLTVEVAACRSVCGLFGQEAFVNHGIFLGLPGIMTLHKFCILHAGETDGGLYESLFFGGQRNLTVIPGKITENAVPSVRWRLF